MKNGLFYIIISLSLLVLFSGCAPELAQTKYGPEENQWKNYIAKSYREWVPPATLPPLSAEKNSEITQTSIEIVPEPANMQVEELPIIKSQDKDLVIQPVAIVAEEIPSPIAETFYTVQKGDTLWIISKKFYNDGTQWKKIQEANKDKLSAPEKLKIGMTLKIPGVQR